MKTAAVRLDASREQLRRGLQAVPEAVDPGQALAADWLSAATGLGGPSLVDGLKQWARAEVDLRLAPPVRRHPLLAVAAAAGFGVLLTRTRWPRRLLAALVSQALLPRVVDALTQRRSSPAAPASPLPRK